jgi:hypothetical protein
MHIMYYLQGLTVTVVRGALVLSYFLVVVASETESVGSAMLLRASTLSLSSYTMWR